MNPATWPRQERVEERLLRVDRVTGAFTDARVGELPRMLRSGDLVVVNDAATLPVSLHGTAGRASAPVEVRLVARRAGSTPGTERWSAVLFGPGDWRTRTEDRPAPPVLRAGDNIGFGDVLHATVRAVSTLSPRLVEVDLDPAGPSIWSAIYAVGRPVQYAHLERPLALWHVQNGYASRPWSAEMPSAGRPLTFAVLADVRRRGVGVVPLTHAAGLSSTGDAALDAALPLDEAYDIPEATVAAIARTRAAGGRVVATGTSVVRALEGCARDRGRVVAGEGETSLLIGAGFEPRVVSGLLTGMHEKTETHFGLLQAFLSASVLERALAHANRAGYLCHEFGDSMLVL